MLSYALLKSHVEIVENPMFFFRFRHARAADARMWSAWYYLSGIVPLASARMSLKEFNASATVAREGPFDRNVETQLFF